MRNNGGTCPNNTLCVLAEGHQGDCTANTVGSLCPVTKNYCTAPCVGSECLRFEPGFQERNAPSALRLKITVPDAINPSYYHGDAVMRFIEEFNLSFCLGNTVKYIARQYNKNKLEDLKKARWYLDREITNMEKNQS